MTQCAAPVASAVPFCALDNEPKILIDQPKPSCINRKVFAVAATVLFVVIPLAIMVTSLDVLAAHFIYQVFTGELYHYPFRLALGVLMVTTAVPLCNIAAFMGLSKLQEDDWTLSLEGVLQALDLARFMTTTMDLLLVAVRSWRR